MLFTLPPPDREGLELLRTISACANGGSQAQLEIKSLVQEPRKHLGCVQEAIAFRLQMADVEDDVAPKLREGFGVPRLYAIYATAVRGILRLVQLSLKGPHQQQRALA